MSRVLSDQNLGKSSPLTETSFASAWLAGDTRARHFLDDGFRSADARRAHVERAKTRVMPAPIHAALKAQNARLGESAARVQNLELLSRPGAVVIATGQQLGLFLGPLFTLYKAAAAIVDARAITRETGVPCVPVFWLQNEDHDFDEIAQCLVPRGADGPLRVSIDGSDRHPRVPVGGRQVGESVHQALALLMEELGMHAHALEHLALLADCYQPERTLSDAFAELVARVFADDGLVIVDPRDPALAPFSAPLHRRALTDAAAIATALTNQCKALVDAGFKPQVHVRDGAPLSFFAPDADDGPRYRLARAADETFTLVGDKDSEPSSESGPRDLSGARRFTLDALLSTLDAHPLRFSTSALLRPLLQDTWLPTVAYVGGPGECAYFAELAPLYAHLGVEMPLFTPRARFRVLDDRARALLEKLEITADDAALPRDALLQKVGAGVDESMPAPDVVSAHLLATITPALHAFGAKLGALDPSLTKAAARADDVVTDAVSRLVAKYARALAQRDAVTGERVDRLRAMLVPEGAPQERIFGMPYYACRFGTREFARFVVDNTEPFSGALKDLRP
jgi:bacillithiol biosynthesis cysteine-adding enzyme BshC